MKEIKTILQEAEFYRSQGLLQDALKKYITASKKLMKHGKNKTNKKMMQSITRRIKILEQDIYHKKDGAPKPELSKTSQDLVKNLFSYSDDLEKDEAAFEGAKLLAELGQYKRAIQEFSTLLANKKYSLVAAKNIIRCHISGSTPEQAVEQFRDWLDEGLFQNEELEKLRFFIDTHFKKYKIEMPLPELDRPVSHDEAEARSGSEDEIMDIISIVLSDEHHDSLKGNELELDVNFQNSEHLNVIIPNNQIKFMEHYQPGDTIEKIQFYSTEAFFMGAVRVASATRIDSGPRKGDYSLDMKMID